MRPWVTLLKDLFPASLAKDLGGVLDPQLTIDDYILKTTSSFLCQASRTEISRVKHFSIATSKSFPCILGKGAWGCSRLATHLWRLYFENHFILCVKPLALRSVVLNIFQSQPVNLFPASSAKELGGVLDPQLTFDDYILLNIFQLQPVT